MTPASALPAQSSGAVAAALPSTTFANPAVVSRSWYPLLRTRHLAAGGIRPASLGSRRLAVYRDRAGAVHVLDARCPHLGADLCQGRVAGDGLRCGFHGWTFGPDGRCREAPSHSVAPDRRARAYPVVERWGFVWVFNGPEPLFPLTGGPADERSWVVRLPPQRIRCHPHLVLANGLDVAHYEGLHGLRLTEPPGMSRHACGVSVSLRGRPLSRWWRLASGSTAREIAADFTTVGGSLAWAAVSSPIRFRVLFTGRPHGRGECLTQTLFFFPQRPGAAWLRALGVMMTLLHDDRRVLEGLEFRPAFSDGDGALQEYARIVNALGAW